MKFNRWKRRCGKVEEITNMNSEQFRIMRGSYIPEEICSGSQLSLKNSATKLKETSSVVVYNNSLISGYC